jgi:hypothetical protein
MYSYLLCYYRKISSVCVVFIHLLLVRDVSRQNYIGLAVPMIKYSICTGNNFTPIVICWAG